MDSEEEKYPIAYYIPHQLEDLTLKLRRSANAWWLDSSKVYLLLDAFDNHNATIEEACDMVGITVKQYKYFARLHPIIHKRRKANQVLEEINKSKKLAEKISSGDPMDSVRWLRHIEPEKYDLRYKSSLTHLKRIHGIPAKPKIKTEEEKVEEMKKQVEKTRKQFLSKNL